ncbi:hypothetical protein [Halobacterium jilantaiense]|uniref:Methyltransferase domain-containing protein n=1 Tax=Halobacterium jilantaiense TaxID=355548 RepID=A0A1I0P9S6_9EURY|nr:hypothetical protein [Halobacterium jilantaiense]SEW10966.1 hypothetical protein SAMN04487945_1510 [Halobacterium jilantaiense]
MDYRELLLLRAARQTGVLDALVSTAGTPAEVAEQAGVSERAAEATVGALVDLGFLQWVGGGVEPTNRLLGFITKTDVRSVGSLPRKLDVVDALVDLPAAMRSGKVPEFGVDEETRLRNRLGAAAARPDAEVRAAVTAAVREHPDAESVLVVGDDAGQHAVEFAQRGFDVAFRHEAAVVDSLRPLLAPEPVELVPGNVTDPVDADADLVLLPHALCTRSEADARDLLAAACESAAEDGVVVTVDRFGSDPALTAELLATTEAGAVREQSTVIEWFVEAGLADAATTNVPGTRYGVVAGRRRAVQ